MQFVKRSVAKLTVLNFDKKFFLWYNIYRNKNELIVKEKNMDFKNSEVFNFEGE